MRIRSAEPGDLSALTAIYNHYVLHTAAVFAEQSLTEEARRPWFAQFAERGPYRLFVAEEDGRLFGYASSVPFLPLSAYRETVETTIFLAPGHTRRGLGTRLYRALFEALAGERLHRAYAAIVPPNRASVALHLRFGFVRAGFFSEYALKWGHYHSSLLMEKRIGRRHLARTGAGPGVPADARHSPESHRDRRQAREAVTTPAPYGRMGAGPQRTNPRPVSESDRKR
ncbi:MAG TPA: GNAT family N-acetyltransferase [bacterium]|nr:GNAT family N-acetyltransferase [bacterium]